MSCSACDALGGYGSLPRRIQPHSKDCPIMLEAEEQARKVRHHEVLCLVLKEAYAALFDGRLSHDDHEVRAQDLHEQALKAADLAYPPPKDGT